MPDNHTFWQVATIVLPIVAGIIGWSIKRELTALYDRLDRVEKGLHERVRKLEDVVFDVAGEVQKVIGALHVK
jgi:hypothetical protein